MGTPGDKLPAFAWKDVASLSANSFPSILWCPGTQHSTTCSVVYAIHRLVLRGITTGFLYLFKVLTAFTTLKESVYVTTLGIFDRVMCLTAASTAYDSALKILVQNASIG